MGLRLRLKASFRTAGYLRQARIVLEALKRYRMLVSDNGSDWFIGAPDPRWSNEQLQGPKRVPGSAFEGADTSRLRPRRPLESFQRTCFALFREGVVTA